MLSLFVRRAGEVLSRTLIAEQVWDMNFDPGTNVVDVHVRRLRSKVDDPFERKLRGDNWICRVATIRSAASGQPAGRVSLTPWSRMRRFGS